MYKYFNELSYLKDFKVYLKDSYFEKDRDKYVSGVKIPYDFLDKYKSLFEKLNFIDILVEGTNEQILEKSPTTAILEYNDYANLYEFFTMKEEQYGYSKSIKNKIDFDIRDLEIIFTDYQIYSNYLIEIYPEYKEMILTIKNLLINALREVKNITKIVFPPLETGVEYTFPNSWYITPNGYLYNTGSGHKEGNLTYPYIFCILSPLKNNKQFNVINNTEQILDILNRQYITPSEFQNYANLQYEIPTIITPLVEHDIEVFRNLSKKRWEEIEKMEKFPAPQRTYQRNILTLVTGYLSAKTALFQSMAKINNSSCKKKIAEQLFELSFDDVLVRFCGFHKISSILDKTITTSTLKNIYSFKEYLDNGWTLDIVPGIIYDEQQDKLVDADFNGYYISRYLETILNEYEGNGKILVKNKNFQYK